VFTHRTGVQKFISYLGVFTTHRINIRYIGAGLITFPANIHHRAIIHHNEGLPRTNTLIGVASTVVRTYSTTKWVYALSSGT